MLYTGFRGHRQNESGEDRFLLPLLAGVALTAPLWYRPCCRPYYRPYGYPYYPTPVPYYSSYNNSNYYYGRPPYYY